MTAAQMRDLLIKIRDRLTYIEVEVMTTAERQIALLLIAAGLGGIKDGMFVPTTKDAKTGVES